MNAQDPFDPAGPEPLAQAQGIADTIGDVSERMLRLVQEEIELAKAEVSEKTTKLVKGAIVAAAAGIFVVTALFFVLVGLALVAWFFLPDDNEIFWGFFVVAAGLVLLAGLAGFIAARAVKAGSPPTPSMAMDEARKIRESVSSGPTTAAGAAAAATFAASASESPPGTAASAGYTPAGGSPAPPIDATSMPGWDPVPTSSHIASVPVAGDGPASGEENRG